MTAHGGASAPSLLLAAALAVIGTAYVVLAARLGPRGWRLRRTGASLLGLVVALWALLGAPAQAAHDSFAGHMTQHLVVGMLAPYLLALGAPVTLVLRAGPARWRRGLRRLLRTAYVRAVAHPLVALLLSVGTLPVLYGTGLYAVAAHRPWLHVLLLGHFFASGYLFAWVICGPDPAPNRPSVPRRLVVLGAAVLVHATVSQLIYAGLFPIGPPLAVDGADVRRGATLMYYGGDLIELALALTLVTQWRPERRSREGPSREPRPREPWPQAGGRRGLRRATRAATVPPRRAGVPSR